MEAPHAVKPDLTFPKRIPPGENAVTKMLRAYCLGLYLLWAMVHLIMHFPFVSSRKKTRMTRAIHLENGRINDFKRLRIEY